MSLARRQFLQTAAAGVAVAAAPRWAFAAEKVVPFRISLAEWSLHKAIRGGDLTDLDFPRVTKEEFGIDAVEYVSQLWGDKQAGSEYVAKVKQQCDDHGVRSVLIMVDAEGALGDADGAKRSQAIDNHKKWLEAARELGCHAIRVNAQSSGSYAEQLALAADGLGRLGEIADQYGLNVLVENHGGLSSNGEWLAGVMRRVGRPNVGTLPDFGNFCISGRGTPDAVWYDRYQGMEDLMPFAKAVSAKSYEFNDAGEEVQTDFPRVMKTVLNHGYSGYVGIEWEGGNPCEYEGIKLTKALLERIRDSVV
ncbi:Xylose isomerase-like TIM barrel [Botrimarina colliarenosi]|uniref:Xylose isomerase-like TIM barrel n=1 Tax=Botrimarina colliarenosi TaxID=2528001 RepID=A0A5C6A710_9BACT|nr:sugar phosphate isomerase/epimerase family protein [Botrimarina colliarenosi]TWT95180.1 Xylose isomerase-like TIM barrel [Botrimarina colliarenosi]